MTRKKHPYKEIEKALCHAETKGWRIQQSKGSAHSWGQMLCPLNNAYCRAGRYCRLSIWSTPKSPFDHARNLMKIVNKCEFLNEEK